MADLEMISDPQRWPVYMFLPLIKRDIASDGIWLRSGVIWRGEPLKVVEANLWALPPTKEEFMALPGKVYVSVQAILDDGWAVD